MPKITYLNCQSCGRLLPYNKFKSGFCPPCLRGRIAAARSLYDEAVRLIGVATEAGENSFVWGECLIFCKLAREKIGQAEAETGQPLVGTEELAVIDAFMMGRACSC